MRTSLKSLTLALLAAAALVPAARADDRDLLRFDTAKPYLFIIFDTSSSMNLKVDNTAVRAAGDDPASKLYQAKSVVYDVFKTVDDVQFGFASFNHDDLKVQAKHWLYYPTQSAPASPTWPIAYPTAATLVSGEPTAASDVWVFGKHLGIAPIGQAGTPAAPLALASARAKINRFPKAQIVDNAPLYSYDPNDTNLPTVHYISTTGPPRIWRLTVTRPPLKSDGTANGQFGDFQVQLNLAITQVTALGVPTGSAYADIQINFSLLRAFFMHETDGATGGGGGGNATERNDGLWDWQDAVNTATCGVEHPFSGSGWEGNYDGTFTTVPGFAVDARQDPYAPAAGFATCDRNNPASCANNLLPTLLSPPLPPTIPPHPNPRPLDFGDQIPLHWTQSYKDEFLSRMNPNHGSGGDDFGVANYFEDLPDASGFLPLRSRSRVPLVGSGVTQLAKSVNDFRCWYLGADASKCNKDGSLYPNGGWEAISASFDDKWGCRRPYLIIISDGDDTCGGENPCADTANLNSKASVKTWVVAYGANCAHPGNPLGCLAQNGKGELVCPNNPQNLKDELLKILGLIREETRAFASAAVPTVQAAVQNQVFVSTFNPLQGEAVWDGHINAFLKPLPIDPISKRPALTPLCSSLPADEQGGCFLWDAGAQLKTQVDVSPTPDFLDETENRRRVFYSRDPLVGLWSRQRRFLDPTTTIDPISRDLAQAFNLLSSSPPPTPAQETAAQTAANNIIKATLSMKSADFNGTQIEFILGDIFHSDPLVVGTPPNVDYFLTDPTYEAFFQKHVFRRKVLLVGSNDGMLHAFNVGVPDVVTSADFLSRSIKEVKFDNGTGKELWAYMPRSVMPTVRQLATGNSQKFAVDGTPAVADVFIDPDGHRANFTHQQPQANEREWRTVVVGGLREGGSGYYALDLTQPEPVVTNPDILEGQVPQITLDNVPTCLGDGDSVTNGPVAGCGPLPYPSVLWEFADTELGLDAEGDPVRVRLDEDANGFADLGDTWSVPNIGRIRICEQGNSGNACELTANGNHVVTKYVAIFGGGMDSLSRSGNYLYMVDIETGEVIYKRQLLGATPSDPAAVDTDRDGYLDRIYIGTILGNMYRVDIGANGAGEYPALENASVRDMNGTTHATERVLTADWNPKLIFRATVNAADPPRPIFYPPTVIFVPKVGASTFALAFGVGDRENLWSVDNREGRFFLFVDDTDLLLPADLPRTEADFVPIDDAAANLAAGTDYLVSRLTGQKGWYIVLDITEKVITDAFSLSGITVFSTFKPRTEVSSGRDPLCARTGNSRVFVVYTTNANGVLGTVAAPERFRLTNTFVTPPYDEVGLSKNEGTGTGSTDADLLDANQLAIMENLKLLFPAECRFANHRIDIKAISGDTEVLQIAPIPICIINKNWREH